MNPRKNRATLDVINKKRLVPSEYNMSYQHFSLARNFKLADFITLCNAACGFSSLLLCLQVQRVVGEESSVRGGGGGEGNIINSSRLEDVWLIRKAFLFPFLGCLFDVLDGRVARWTRNGVGSPSD
jgi:phosphatidylserine synthase